MSYLHFSTKLKIRSLTQISLGYLYWSFSLNLDAEQAKLVHLKICLKITIQKMESWKLSADNEHSGRPLRQQSNALLAYIIYLYRIYIAHLSFQAEFSRQLYLCLNSSALVVVASKWGKYLPAPGGRVHRWVKHEQWFREPQGHILRVMGIVNDFCKKGQRVANLAEKPGFYLATVEEAACTRNLHLYHLYWEALGGRS